MKLGLLKVVPNVSVVIEDHRSHRLRNVHRRQVRSGEMTRFVNTDLKDMRNIWKIHASGNDICCDALALEASLNFRVVLVRLDCEMGDFSQRPRYDCRNR